MAAPSKRRREQPDEPYFERLPTSIIDAELVNRQLPLASVAQLARASRSFSRHAASLRRSALWCCNQPPTPDEVALYIREFVVAEVLTLANGATRSIGWFAVENQPWIQYAAYMLRLDATKDGDVLVVRFAAIPRSGFTIKDEEAVAIDASRTPDDIMANVVSPMLRRVARESSFLAATGAVSADVGYPRARAYTPSVRDPPLPPERFDRRDIVHNVVFQPRLYRWVLSRRAFVPCAAHQASADRCALHRAVTALWLCTRVLTSALTREKFAANVREWLYDTFYVELFDMTVDEVR